MCNLLALSRIEVAPAGSLANYCNCNYVTLYTLSELMLPVNTYNKQEYRNNNKVEKTVNNSYESSQSAITAQQSPYIH